jgi:16S rRNA (cytosine1402-N4)-methyltransferase
MSDYHTSVLLHESVDGLAIKPDGVYVDVTFGGGGHSRLILEKLGPNGKLFAFDQDADAQKNLWDDARLTLIPQNFRYLKNSLRMYGAKEVDGILADLGVSSHQFDVAERGFSTRFDADLDMRMNQSASKSAKDIVNEYAEIDLKKMLWAYAELKNSGRVAGAICAARAYRPITTIAELKEATIDCAPKFKENRFYAQLFQAIRIEVNEEMQVLKEMLEQTSDVLKPGGRLSVIAYHSLEDRLVKHFMRYGNFEGEPQKDFYGNLIAPFKPVNRKPLIPNEAEIESNNRARSAKLRVSDRV